SLLDVPPSSGIPVDGRELDAFFREAGVVIAEAEARQREHDRTNATRFNLFHWLEPDENKLSDILADLLDPLGRHGQGTLFWRLLLEQLRIESPKNSARSVHVQREAPTHGILKYRRRIDILVEADAIVAVENKIDSSEQTDQVKDYLDHL